MRSSSDPLPPGDPPPPLVYLVAPRGETVERLGERAVADPYRLLEDAAHPDTRRWSAAQHDLFRRVAQRWPGAARSRPRWSG